MAQNISERGFSVHKNALPLGLSLMLQEHLRHVPRSDFRTAGIGRKNTFHVDQNIRSDKVLWIDEISISGAAWIDWASSMQAVLNRRLFLGLFSFESHYSHYEVAGFYARHLDAFRGEGNRVLSIVTYLNSDWSKEDAGELVLYLRNGTEIKVAPEFGTLVAFLSEEISHEVLATNCDRFSIAGWFRTKRPN